MYGTYASTSYGSSSSSSSKTPPSSRACLDPSPFRYEVRAGDTLESIADKLHTTEKKLLKLNPLLTSNASSSKKAHRIKVYPGQQLVVEEARHVSLPPPPKSIDFGWGHMHVMRSGETLADIAALYNTTEAWLRQDNRVYFPAGERGAIAPGHMLRVRFVNIGQLEPEEEVPVAMTGPSSSSSTSSSPASSSSLGLGVPTTVSKYKTHCIKKSDTFASLCEDYKIEYAVLLQINRGRFPIGARADLVVGEQLIVPDFAATHAEQKRRNVAEIKLTKQIHIVEAGETPHGIAARYRMSYDELREYNRAFFPKGYRGEIRPGNKLVVKRLDEDEEEFTKRRDDSDGEEEDDDEEDEDEDDEDEDEEDRMHGYNTLA